MTSARSLLLACTALTAVATFALPASASVADKSAASTTTPIILAQAPPPPAEQKKEEPKKEEPKPAPPAAKPAPAPAAPPPAAKPAAPPPPPPPAAKPPAPPAPPAAKPPAAPPPAAAAPKPPAPPAAQAPSAPAVQPASPPSRSERRDRPPESQRGDRPDRSDRPDRPRGERPPEGQRPSAPPPPAAQPKPADKPAASDAKPATPPPPAASDAKPATPPAAASDAKPATPPPAAQQRPGSPPPPAAQQQQPPASATVQRAPQGDRPAFAPPPPPTQSRSASEFIRRDDKGPQRGFDDIRRERRETRDGNRTIITEGDRTIVRDGNRTIIRHNEADRFAIDARDVRVTRRGNDTISIIVRPDGAQIITTTGNDGRLLRRVRRDRSGREVVIIDNRFAGPRRDIFVDVRPPRWRGPQERYILDGRRADREAVYTLFLAPPIQRIERRYTLDEVRYSEPLRAYMPRVDLDVHFDTGSWQIAPNEVEQLATIADGIKRAVAKNPREVFMIEGHTDAVGSDEDNLSLSDRRAESVAVALTEQFQVPPENLVTQGYGEEYLKVQTEGPSEENRRVAVRRITPLIDQQAAR